VEVSRAGYQSADTVVLARADIYADALGDTTGHAFVVEGVHADPDRGWPDAVSAAPFAAHQGQAILLATRDQLPTETMAAFEARGISTTTVVGGTAAVSQEVFDALAADGRNPSRIAGADRYATSAAVLAAALEAGVNPAELWLATGRGWPDALTSGPTAAALGHGLLLIDGHDLEGSPASMQALQELAGTLQRVKLLGGPQAIADGVRDQVESAIARQTRATPPRPGRGAAVGGSARRAWHGRWPVRRRRGRAPSPGRPPRRGR
jgi:hypothetical protein